ncbi:hypothetical protein [Flavobacterium columnare]|uniref:hypothetical protein n=1 Tax=Flavobacterium columnare TaxID=996 RepID=UPI0014767DD8|nr:hypothetical protein [Flavobacterium columnare]
MDFFSMNNDYLVKAKFLKLTTTTERKVIYKVYGLLGFEIKGVKEELVVYQIKN